MMSLTVWLREASEGPRSNVKTPCVYFPYWTYHGLSRPNFRFRFASIAAGSARSDFRNGFPLICLIRRNVNRITISITGIVQTSRRMTNLVTWPPCSQDQEWKRTGAGSRPPPVRTTSRLVLLDLDLRQVELVEQVDVERLRDPRLLELDVRVPVDRRDRHRTVRAGQLVLQLLVDLEPRLVVRRVLR